MDIANIRSQVFRKFLLLSRVNQYNHFLLKVFGVKCRGHSFQCKETLKSLAGKSCNWSLSKVEKPY